MKYKETLLDRVHKELSDRKTERAAYLEGLLLNTSYGISSGRFQGTVRVEAPFREKPGPLERKALYEAIDNTVDKLMAELDKEDSSSPIAMIEKGLIESFKNSSRKKVVKSKRASKAKRKVKKTSSVKNTRPYTPSGKNLKETREQAVQNTIKSGIAAQTARVSTAEKFKRRRAQRALEQGRLASSPLMLLTLLNQQLPSVVAKNMGSPRLNYRTGRFANSVEAVDVNVTAQGYLSVGYTYMKYPYQTFEPGWAQGSVHRDPRKLIDLSIREIAVKFAIGRFYTRRL